MIRDNIMTVDVVTESNDFDDWHRQYIRDDDKLLTYEVCDLWDCPEDAVIYRDLFNCWDYIDAINYGVELYKKFGIEKVVGNSIEKEGIS